MGAKLARAGRIIGIDVREEKLLTAKEFGATDAILFDHTTKEELWKMTDGRGADYIFEAIGDPAVQEQCLDLLRPGGTLTLVGIAPMGTSTNLPGAVITRQEKTIRGAYYGTCNTARQFADYANLYLDGILQLDRLVTQKYKLSQINEAYADLLSGKLTRGVIVF